jgi:hypothetical protein
LIWIALALLAFTVLAEPLGAASFTEKVKFEFDHQINPNTRHP